jgi:hypothetical protein
VGGCSPPQERFDQTGRDSFANSHSRTSGRSKPKELPPFLWHPLASSHIAPRVALARTDLRQMRLSIGHFVEDREEEPIFHGNRLLLITHSDAHG